MLPNFETALFANEALSGFLPETPLVDASGLLDDANGATVIAKLEPFQKTGSFKFRGALWRCMQLNQAERDKGVVAYSSGNFAQALAAAATSLSVPCTIVMPVDAPAVKRSRTEAFGARVVLSHHQDEPREVVASRLAKQIAIDEGMALLHPFDDPAIVAGHASMGFEILSQIERLNYPKPDVVLCCAGGGGLVSGLALALKELMPSTRVIPIEPVSHDGLSRSLESDERIAAPGDRATICDALQAPMPGEVPFEVLRRCNVTNGLTVTDAEVRQAMWRIADDLHLVVEPSGAVATAALLQNYSDFRNQCVLVVISGANILLSDYIKMVP